MKSLLSLKGTGFSVSQKFFFSLLTVLFLVTSCKKEALTESSNNVAAANNLSSEKLVAATTAPQEFGAWISGYTIDQKIQGCSQLLVSYVRDAVELKSFKGKSNAIDSYLNNGYKVLLNFVYENPSGGKAAPFPTDMTEYKNLLNKALDKYQPEIAVIENEPTTDKFHSGPIENYITELKTAVSICKQRGIKVADGGLILQWVQSAMNGYSNADPNYTETKKLIDAYKTIDLDYVNIHVHAPFTNHDSPDVFPQNTLTSVANYLRTQIGKPVICNEYNQHNTSTALMSSAVNAFKVSDVKYFIAHSNDDDGKGKPLYTGSGLTSIGVAYKDAIK
jgi:hypothetical protein